MSGHSKWSQIKNQKGAADKKRANVFTKLAGIIVVAAREGGGDPEANFKLRLAMDRAKAANMPKDNIQRAIDRGTGKDTEGATLEEVLYEGFGPDGVAYVVKVLTDNRNRSAADMRALFSKYGGNLSGSNSVLWMFNNRGVITVAKEDGGTRTPEDIELLAIDHNALDVQTEVQGVTIVCEPENLSRIQKALEVLGVRATDATVELVPTTPVTDASAKEHNQKLMDELDDNDDVISVAHNLSDTPS